MRTLDYKQYKRIMALGYDGFGVVQATDNNTGERWLEIHSQDFVNLHGAVACPLYEQAAEWLRKKHGLLIYVTYSLHQRLYYINIHDTIYGYKYCGCLPPEASKDYDTALENAVLKAMQIIEDKKQ